MTDRRDSNDEQMIRRTYWQNLLQVKMTVTVVLAEKRMPAASILKLVPGAMLPFDTPADEPLRLQADNKTLAVGDVIKVGDKFGLKIQSVHPARENWIDVRERITAIRKQIKGKEVSSP